MGTWRPKKFATEKIVFEKVLCQDHRLDKICLLSAASLKRSGPLVAAVAVAPRVVFQLAEAGSPSRLTSPVSKSASFAPSHRTHPLRYHPNPQTQIFTLSKTSRKLPAKSSEKASQDIKFYTSPRTCPERAISQPKKTCKHILATGEG
jgi:hypothetical protein